MASPSTVKVNRTNLNRLRAALLARDGTLYGGIRRELDSAIAERAQRIEANVRRKRLESEASA